MLHFTFSCHIVNNIAHIAPVLQYSKHALTDRLLQLLCTYTAVCCKPYFDELMTVQLCTGDDKKVKRLFYATVHCLMGR
jgi:hypothetical protein